MASTLLFDFESLTERDPSFPVCERASTTWTRNDIATLAASLDVGAPRLPCGSLIALQCANGPLFLAALLMLRRRSWVAMLVDPTTPETAGKRLASRYSCHATLAIRDAWPEMNTLVWKNAPWSWSTVAAESAPFDPEIAVIKLTSGSSGEPRGVVVQEGALLADETALFRSMGLAEERILTTIPLSHSYGLTSIALAVLRRDMTIVAPPTSSPVSILRTLRTASISFFPSVPAWLRAMVKLGDGGPASVGSTRLVISAGAPLQDSTAQEFDRRFGKPIQPFYGASECGGIAFDRTGQAGLLGALGTAIHGVEIELHPTDGENRRGYPNSQQGTVVVRSPAIASGYLQPGPKHHIQTDEYSLTKGRFKTSDLGQFEGNTLRILGRQDDVINLKGKKVHPGEVERVLIAMNGIDEAHVFCECPPDRPDSPVLKALVAASSALHRADIQKWCRRQLADHKVPRAVTVVKQLPRTPRGKLDRAHARALCVSQTPAREASTHARP